MTPSHLRVIGPWHAAGGLDQQGDGRRQCLHARHLGSTHGHLFADEHRVAARRLEAMLSSGIHPANQNVNAVTGSSVVFLLTTPSTDGVRTLANTR